jgi:hypothetical protein
LNGTEGAATDCWFRGVTDFCISRRDVGYEGRGRLREEVGRRLCLLWLQHGHRRCEPRADMTSLRLAGQATLTVQLAERTHCEDTAAAAAGVQGLAPAQPTAGGKPALAELGPLRQGSAGGRRGVTFVLLPRNHAGFSFWRMADVLPALMEKFACEQANAGWM